MATVDDYTKAGMDQALGLMNKAAATYPNFVPTASRAPSTYSYYEYTPTAPMAQVAAPDYHVTAQADMPAAPSYAMSSYQANAAPFNWQSQNTYTPWDNFYYQKLGLTGPAYQTYAGAAPVYQGLMGGDYARLEAALATPGAIAAQDAYQQGLYNLQNTMGARGLYGSSMMQNQQTNQLDKVLQNALATNAANATTQRYTLEQTDRLNTVNAALEVYKQKMAEQGALNAQDLANYQALMAEQKQMNDIMASQNLAKNAQALEGTKLGVTQGLAQNQANLDYAKLGTEASIANANNASAQQQAINSLLSSNYENQAKLAMTREAEQNKYAAQMAALKEQENKDLFSTGLMENTQKNLYDAGRLAFDQTQDSLVRDWQNKSDYEKYTYDVAQAAYQNQLDEQAFNRALSVAGQGGQLGTAAQNYQLAMQQNQTASQAAQAASAAANTQAWLGLAGSLGGGLLSAFGNSAASGASSLASLLSGFDAI